MAPDSIFNILSSLGVKERRGKRIIFFKVTANNYSACLIGLCNRAAAIPDWGHLIGDKNLCPLIPTGYASFPPCCPKYLLCCSSAWHHIPIPQETIPSLLLLWPKWQPQVVPLPVLELTQSINNRWAPKHTEPGWALRGQRWGWALPRRWGDVKIAAEITGLLGLMLDFFKALCSLSSLKPIPDGSSIPSLLPFLPQALRPSPLPISLT